MRKTFLSYSISPFPCWAWTSLLLSIQCVNMYPNILIINYFNATPTVGRVVVKAWDLRVYSLARFEISQVLSTPLRPVHTELYLKSLRLDRGIDLSKLVDILCVNWHGHTWVITNYFNTVYNHRTTSWLINSVLPWRSDPFIWPNRTPFHMCAPICCHYLPTGHGTRPRKLPCLSANRNRKDVSTIHINWNWAHPQLMMLKHQTQNQLTMNTGEAAQTRILVLEDIINRRGTIFNGWRTHQKTTISDNRSKRRLRVQIQNIVRDHLEEKLRALDTCILLKHGAGLSKISLDENIFQTNDVEEWVHCLPSMSLRNLCDSSLFYPPQLLLDFTRTYNPILWEHHISMLVDQ